MKHFMQAIALNCAFALLILVITLVTVADAIPGEDSFQANMDYAVFFNRETGPYIEIYYGFSRSILVAVEKEDGKKYGEALIAVRITKDDRLVVNDLWRMQVEPEDSLQNSNLVDMVRYDIEPGEYKLAFHIRDVYEQSKRDSVAIELEIDQYMGKGVFLSDIELSTNIKKSAEGEKSNFTKSTLEVIPNPSSVYGEERPVLFFYVEAYNLFSGIQGEKYQTHCWVTDNDNNEVAGCPSIKRTKTRKFDASVEVGTLNISKLTSGFYNFNFAIGEKREVMSTKRFVVYREGEMKQRKEAKEQLAAGVKPNEFTYMNTEQLDQEFDLLQYLLNDVGKKFYAQLETENAKRNFIYSFWKTKDPQPATDINEYRAEYFERLEYANEQFGRIRRDGWRTDRGRVFMIYGPPDDRDRFPSSAGNYPYEIWNYNSYEGGVVFVFVDERGLNDYMLVHSDATGEIRDENWKNRASAFRQN